MEKESHFYLKIVGYILLGLIVLGVILGIGYIVVMTAFSSAEALIGFFVLYILPILFALMIIIAVIFVLYIALYIGVAVRYLGKPMKVSKEEKRYDLKKTKEAGKRQKGSSKKK